MHRIKFNFVLAILALTVACLSATGATAKTSADHDLRARFAYLKTHGNSACSQAFMASIAMMPAGARLQGSCCSPMVLDRYIQQVRGLKKYANVPQIPSDPYDIAAGLARK